MLEGEGWYVVTSSVCLKVYLGVRCCEGGLMGEGGPSGRILQPMHITLVDTFLSFFGWTHVLTTNTTASTAAAVKATTAKVIVADNTTTTAADDSIALTKYTP